jgi:hypothetical protein
MQGEVQLIVTSGSTEYVNNGLWTISPGSFAGSTSWNINLVTDPLSGVPSYSFFTVGTIIAAEPGIAGAVQSCVITSIDTLTGDVTTDVGLDFSNLSPIPVSATMRISTFIDTVVPYYLDLFENESISQNWKFQDLSNFTAQGAFSREFRIPFSERNQVALGALFDVNVTASDANYFHYKLPAEIRVDTLPIATGYIRVRKVYRQLNRINEVEIAFYAETPDLARNIGEKKLSDISDLLTLDEVVNYQNVTTATSKRIWTFLDRGQIWSIQNYPNTRPIADLNEPVWPADLTPAINWWYMFEEIFKDAGFELVAGTLQNILQEYWMPFCNTRQLKGSDYYNNFLFRAYASGFTGLTQGGTGVIADIDTETYDNNNNFDTATNTYTTPNDGYYTFHIYIKFEIASLQQRDVIVGLKIDGDFIPYDTFTINNYDVVDFTWRIGIDAASSVQLWAYTLAPDYDVSMMGYEPLFARQNTFIELQKTEFNFGQTVYHNLNAPDMKQIDFVTDVIKMHNCAIVPDRTTSNKLYVVPQNSYLGSGDILDWTSKLDTSKDIVLTSTVDLQKGKFKFTYTAGDDVLSQKYKNANRIYGDYEVSGYTVNPNYAASDFATGDQTIQLVTRSTPSGDLIGLSQRPMQFFYNDSLEFVPPGPRCLYNCYDRIVALYDDSINAAVYTDIPVLNHYNERIPDIFDYDLNWAPESPGYPITGNPYNNLFNTYWRGYMNSLYNPDARIMEAFFALDLKDIITFKFSDKIWIQDCYWRILEVSDYKIGLQESTKVKLLKFLDDVEDCFSTPVSVSVNGEVNFQDAQGDPVEPSQDCCTRYGYNWDEANGVCWAFTLSGSRPTTNVDGSPTNPSPRPTAAQTRNQFVTGSIINGTDISIHFGNSNMLAVGNKLELTAPVNGSNLLGKNVTTNLPGMHLGGGWKNGNIASAEKGWAQSGEVIMHYKDAWIDSQIYDLFVEGVNGFYLELSDDTIWSCFMKATIVDAANNVCTGQYSFQLSKFAGVAYMQGVNVIDEINGTIYTFTFNIDTTTNTAQHRLNLQVTGLGALSQTFIVTASIQYQQNKIT